MGGHVGVASVALFAGSFVQNIGGVGKGGEEPAGAIEEVVGPLGPNGLGGVVCEDSGTVEVDTASVSEGSLVDDTAVLVGAGAVVDVIALGVDESYSSGPIPDLLRPVEVGVIACGAGHASGDLEEASVTNGVLVIQAVRVRCQNLPPKPSVTSRGIPAACQLVEDVGANLEPGRDGLVGLGEVALASRDGGRSPKEEVVVALLPVVLLGHVVEIGTKVGGVSHCLDEGIVVACVSGIMVVVKHGAPHGSSDPPVVGILKIADILQLLAWRFVKVGSC